MKVPVMFFVCDHDRAESPSASSVARLARTVFIIPVLPDSSHFAFSSPDDTPIFVAARIYNVPVKGLRL